MKDPMTSTTVERKNALWVEKYRPQSINDCILPQDLKDTFNEMVVQGIPQNLLLSGGAGCGKTTVAKALCNEVGADWIMVNCSEDGNIDTLRTRIRNFASTVSFEGGNKVVILDEFDYANSQSMQPALRGFIEEFSENCRFIITCNFKNRIIQPIHSRCTCINFGFSKEDTIKLGGMFLKRSADILAEEGIEYDREVLARLIMRHSPDFRRVLNELQRYSVSGVVDVGILSDLSDVIVDTLMKNMKKKNFGEVRSWVVHNLDNDPTQIFRKIYDALSEYLEPKSVPAAILIIAEYQYKSAFVVDHEINMTACLTELMMECELR